MSKESNPTGITVPFGDGNGNIDNGPAINGHTVKEHLGHDDAVKGDTSNQQRRRFLDADIPDLIRKLSLKEKVALLAGRHWWNTVDNPRLDIPSVKVSDGPNGARGGSFFHMTPAIAFPCATALAATFSHDIVRQTGALLAEETKGRGAVCLLAPTVNIQRSPLGGRAFESFSEDPTLSGQLAADYILGLQGGGVSPALKHFVGNDQEHERNGADSVIGERALREVYLRPFQIAQRLAQPWAYMSSYNQVNGVHVSENCWLLRTLLHDEWGFNGLVMSDWYGTYSASDSMNAGMTLEMPGPTIFRTWQQIQHLVLAHKIDPRTIDDLATTVLRWVQKLARKNESIVFDAPGERTRDESQSEDSVFLRRLATEAIVLLKNDRDVLPIREAKIAIIGPHTKSYVLTGGGSAYVNASWKVSPWEGMVANRPSNVQLHYALGCVAHQFLPVLDSCFTCLDKSAGFDLRHYAVDPNGQQSAEPAFIDKHTNSVLLMCDYDAGSLGKEWFTEVRAIFTSPIDGEYEFGLAVTGQGWIWLDDELVVDNSKDQVRGDAFCGLGTVEVRRKFKVEKGRTYSFRMLHDTRSPPESELSESIPFGEAGVRIGAFPVHDEEDLMRQATELARECDKVIIFTGLNADWESEGFDRKSLSLPLKQDRLISQVSASNPNTTVVIQAGSAVSMPWIDDVAAVLYAWYGGNEVGNALADVIYGESNPSGRLPISLPKREFDIAANLNGRSARGKVHYEEGIWVGYKHHIARSIPPLFPFGHGLSYTTFEYSALTVTQVPSLYSTPDEWRLLATVSVSNSGRLVGSHSVHFYTCPPPETATGLRHPSHSLQAFTTVYLQPGEQQTVRVELDKYAISHWDEGYKTWRVEKGEWHVKIGRSAESLSEDTSFTIADDMEWTGL